jgi:phage baseplate assembly protein V
MLGLERQIEELNSRISNLFRTGTVTSLLPADMKARVVFEDRDNMESYDLQVIVKNTLQNKDYWMPDIGETVLCCFLPIGLEQGFIIGGFYPQPVTRPANTENARKVQFGDGTVIEYDRESNKLTVDVKGDIDLITTGNVTATIGGDLTADVTGSVSLTVGGELTADVSGNTTVTTPTLTLNGDLVVNGNANVSGSTTTVGLTTTAGLSSSGGNASITGGDITADGISLKDHTHISASAGNPTGPAQ